MREARNFKAVQLALQEEGLCVRVYESDTACSLDRGVVRGPWWLEDERGPTIGVLAWLREEAHVARLVAVDGHTLESDRRETSTAVPPWFRYIVGAPKKKAGEELI